MQQFALVSLIIAALFGALMLPAAADDPATVDAFVSPGVLIAISADPTSVNYNTLQVGTTGAIPTPAKVAVRNMGNVPVALQIRGQDTADWQLGSQAGPDVYVQRFAPNSSFTPLTTENQQLWANLAPGADIDLSLNLDMPTSTSTTTEQNARVTIVAVQQ